MWILTVASWHTEHLTTWRWVLPSMLIIAWHSLQFIMGRPPWGVAVYGGGSSSGPIGGTVTSCCVELMGSAKKKHYNEFLNNKNKIWNALTTELHLAPICGMTPQHMHIKHCVKTKIVYTENSIKIMKLRAK